MLRAFGAERAPGPAELDAPLPSALPSQIEATLAAEVDPDQAALFARRFRSVAALLAGMSQPEARLLEVALYRRGAQILAEPAPHALRIRALVDYVWSQAAVVQHRRPEAPTLEALAERLAAREVAPGLHHGTIEGISREGPVHLNVLRARAPRLRCLDARGPESLLELARAHGALAAISGGFFLYSEPDIEPPSRRTDPVGALVSEGQVLGPPVFARATLCQRRDGSLAIEQRGMAGVELSFSGGRRVVVGQDAQLVNRAQARVAQGQGPALAVVGSRVSARGEGALPVPLAGFVLRLRAGPLPAVGEEVRYRLPDEPAQAMAGGPFLLGEGALDLEREEFAGSAPPLTFSQDETFDRNLLPRMAVGLRADGELIALAVDGRNAERAPGLTLRGTARVLRALGCVSAMNLDGGSSKRMLVAGRGVDLPST
ncbi:MAG TPA: hypothetical protein DEA08_02485, partial [Planctomycetes bacterium]|nr:hypothetical protein [Planctomycetota bacterium]